MPYALSTIHLDSLSRCRVVVIVSVLALAMVLPVLSVTGRSEALSTPLGTLSLAGFILAPLLINRFG
jgi:hypothetical protein